MRQATIKHELTRFAEGSSKRCDGKSLTLVTFPAPPPVPADFRSAMTLSRQAFAVSTKAFVFSASAAECPEPGLMISLASGNLDGRDICICQYWA